jgi:hypothetical protein
VASTAQVARDQLLKTFALAIGVHATDPDRDSEFFVENRMRGVQSRATLVQV